MRPSASQPHQEDPPGTEHRETHPSNQPRVARRKGATPPRAATPRRVVLPPAIPHPRALKASLKAHVRSEMEMAMAEATARLKTLVSREVKRHLGVGSKRPRSPSPSQ